MGFITFLFSTCDILIDLKVTEKWVFFWSKHVLFAKTSFFSMQT